MMKGRLSAAMVLALAGASCGGDAAGPASAVPASLVGEWVASPACAPPCAFTLTWTENSAARFEAVSVLGLTIRVGIRSSGRMTVSGSGEPSEGEVTVAGATLVVRDTRGVVDTIDYRIEGPHLYLDFRRPSEEVDFDGDGVADPAWVAGVFRKQ